MWDLMLKYIEILGLILYQNSIAKTLTSLQLSASDVSAHVNFPAFARVDLHCGGPSLWWADTKHGMLYIANCNGMVDHIGYQMLLARKIEHKLQY